MHYYFAVDFLDFRDNGVKAGDNSLLGIESYQDYRNRYFGIASRHLFQLAQDRH
jgi:hypothetical protein